MDRGQRTPGTARRERTLWKNLEVGDMALLRDNDEVPADIVVLSTSDAEAVCYLETKNVDNETNRKRRKSLGATSSITSEEDIEHGGFVLESEAAHQNLYLYNGLLKYKIEGTGEEKAESSKSKVCTSFHLEHDRR
jgi:phospholipid-translocating ATPase